MIHTWLHVLIIRSSNEKSKMEEKYLLGNNSMSDLWNSSRCKILKIIFTSYPYTFSVLRCFKSLMISFIFNE